MWRAKRHKLALVSLRMLSQPVRGPNINEYENPDDTEEDFAMRTLWEDGQEYLYEHVCWL